MSKYIERLIDIYISIFDSENRKINIDIDRY